MADEILIPMNRPKVKDKKSLSSPGEILVPLEHFKTIGESLDEPGPEGQPSTKAALGNAFSQMPTVPGVMAEHARPILSTVGGITGNVPGAFVGGAIGQGISDQYAESTGQVEPATGYDAAMSMIKAGSTDAAVQGLTPMVIKGISKYLAAPAARTAVKAGRAVKEALGFGVKPSISAAIPAMPKPPASMVKTPGLADAEAQAIGAGAEHEVAQEAVVGTQRALQEALAGIPDAGTLGTGINTKEGLIRASDIWHREGDNLYAKARSLTHDMPIPIKNFREIGDRIAMENQPTNLAFPRSGGYEPQITKVLKDIQDLGIVRDEEGNIVEQVNEIPFQALDGFRNKLVAMAKDTGNPLAADQAKGILKQFTGTLTDTMEKGLAGTPGSDAWKQARAFWKEGRGIFDHAVITKAMNANPEDVMALIQPASATRPAAITEAKMIRSGLLDYVRANGTPQEVTAAEDTYNKFLRNFTESRLLGKEGGNPATLPKKIDGYRDILDTLYDGTIQGKHIKNNILTVSDAAQRALEKAGALKTAEGALTQAEKESGKTIEKEALLRAKEGNVFNAKQAATREAAEQKVQDRYDRVTRAVGKIADMAALGLGFHGNLAAAVGAISGKKPAVSGSEWLMSRIIQSRKASGMWAKEVEKAIANAANPPDISKMVFRPGDGLSSSDSTWLTNFGKALNETWDFKKDLDPFGPIPKRESK